MPANPGAIRPIQIVSGLDIDDGGPTYSVPALNEALRRIGLQSEIYSDQAEGVASVGPGPGVRIYVRRLAKAPLIGKLHWSPALESALMGDAADGGAVLHSHGLWRLPSIYAARAARATGAPLVVSPRGMLAPAALAISASSKRLFAALLQNRALDATSCFHATSLAELEEIRAYGLRQPVAVVPNGIDVPSGDEAPGVAPPGERSVLFIGRLHPKKALDRLIGAWAMVEREFPSHRLKIVGPSEDGHAEVLRRLVASLGVERVDILPAAYGDEKAGLFAQADLFALSSLNENFGNAVSESLAHAVPVIATKGAPWRELETEHCGWWVDHGVEPMAEALRRALSLPSAERRAMGQRGREWMKRSFSWDRVARDMRDVYEWLGGLRERPDWVSL